ncbi:UDP-N-acetylmuramoyl-L-alanyl-D-glutamate--2,6-diaminopimelate ligase [Nocardioides sp. HDW12B]|uniref:UDP-N-acetylmuramoyl-L-alanyl-D-glutamate--2, 6-diaminopimelate ligase n=1 Tax=Nocardioides sp. HDW12B TaxID=2714939 RepID=UPI0023F7ED30|nr:UDP-N-acetylmuramoyl-L-alanyl-D-glutamate--2,6-diaminopimelate ligase [Nocardioides sp. HDW12B]
MALEPDDRAHAADVVLTGVTMNSRLVQPGDLYVAAAGATTHGARFAAPAVEAGAVAVLTDDAGAELCRAAEVGVPVLVVAHPRAVVGGLAAWLYGEPARSLALVAVTGTQGKTTTTRLAEAALEVAGVPAGVVGTIGTRVAGEAVTSSLTTPEAPDLHALLAVMVERGVRCCAMEVSSHALVMGRVDGVVFDVAAFTNLGRDHLDFHADVEDYYQAKASLFTPERARRGLVNVDDEHGRRLLAEARIPMTTYAVAPDPDHGPEHEADWRAVEVEATASGSRFVVEGPGGVRVGTEILVPGAFNVSNALCAVALLAEAGLDPVLVAESLARVSGVPGRLERVDAGQDFLAVVDYAHKPDAVEAALSSLRERTTGRLIVVLGAGGDRDRGKRPLMGEVAARLADLLVVTDDNPRTEDPAAIRGEVLAGARRAGPDESLRAEVHEEGDRRAAIRHAVAQAGPGDTVVVAGKGHETGQEVAGVVHPFDDRVELRAALEARTGAPS